MDNPRRRNRVRPAAGVPSYVLLAAVSFFSFFAGTVFTSYSSLGQCRSDGVDGSGRAGVLPMVRRMQAAQPAPNQQQHGTDRQPPAGTRFPHTTSRYAVGMTRVDKLDFAQHIDTGVPLDLPKHNGDSDVLLLYGHPRALPDGYAALPTDDGTIPSVTMAKAVEHCDALNVVLTDHSYKRQQCIAVVPQYESYHIQKWMRDNDGDRQLRMVSRGMQDNGKNQFAPPREHHIRQNWELLTDYFANYDQSLQRLRQVLEAMHPKDNTVIVMVTNFGQSELLFNFVCAAHSRGLSSVLEQILVFATDLETKKLAESIGLHVYFDEKNFGSMPEEAAGNYGDRRFTAMMMAKVICVQMVSALHYNLLFQDVDIVWFKNPLEYFQSPQHMGNADFDIYFQDDGGHSVRYAPYSANSGFYYVKHNDRTQYFLTSLLLAGDLILKTDSHQQALIALLSEHVSLYGLKAKVLSRDTPEFPGGYHYHQATGKFMRALFNREVDPYIFHMSWTKNKDNKLLFLKQMGEWYVREQCIHQHVDAIEVSDGGDLQSTCCSVQPLITCHYRDKPSIVPCQDSPPIDAGKKSFW